jgi:hypothetical protein
MPMADSVQQTGATMTEATSSARAAVRGIAVVLLVILALFAVPPQAARADGVISGVTEDQAGNPVSVPIALYTSPAGDFVGFVVSDSGTGAFAFASAPDGDYTISTSTSTGFVETTLNVTVASGGTDVGTISLYRFGTVSGTIANFSVVQHTMQIWVDEWSGSGWNTVSTTLVSPTGSDGHPYTAANAIPGPGYYRVTFVPDTADAFLRTYSGGHATTFPGDDPSTTSIVGVFQATGYEQSFTGIDVTLALPAPPSGGGSGGGSSSGPSSGSGGTPAGAGTVTNAAPAPQRQPTAQPSATPTPEAPPTQQPQPQPTPDQTGTAAEEAEADGASGPWLFIVLAVVVVVAVGGLAWLLFRRR